MSRRPIVDTADARVEYIPPGDPRVAFDFQAQPSTPMDLLGKVLGIMERARGPGDALRVVLDVKEEVDRWEVRRPLPRNPHKGLQVRGPDGGVWVWTGDEWKSKL